MVGRLWSELIRRRVVKTSIAYVVMAWIIVEGASTIFPSLLLPDWTVRLVTIIAILGLPLVIILAWMFDIRVAGDSEEAPSETVAEKQEAVAEAPTTLAPPSLKSVVASIAVLPFRNLSREDRHRFVADGIATELHSVLAKVHRLRVASRTSSFTLAGKSLTVRELAERLNVHFVLSGSVECIEDRARVIVELDNAEEDVQIWTESYDRDLEDIFSLQNEIAMAITSEFPGARLRDEITSAASRPTDSLDAWSLVQRARSFTLLFTPQALSDAVPLLRQAIELDSDYAAAHAALASVLSERVLNGLSEQATVDRRIALESADRASTNAPVDPFVLKMCAVAWAYFGEPKKAIEALRRAVDIAPFDFGAWGFMGWPLVERGLGSDLDEVHSVMKRILAAAPMHPGAPYWMYHRSVAFTCQGEIERAVEFAHQSVTRNPSFPWGLMQYANVLGTNGDANGAREAIERCRKISPGLTTDYYRSMVEQMSGSQQFAVLRTAGIPREEE